jgi:FHA domain-containing protein
MRPTTESSRPILRSKSDRDLQALRKEKPLPRPKPPARPPGPGGINAPGSGGTPGGMVCPGTAEETRRTAVAPGRGQAVDATALETPAQRVLSKPGALGGKSIHLTVVEGETKGRSFDLTGLGTYTIGRSECDIVIEDERISRKHASITIIREKQYAVTDLASKNGTYVNGVRLTRRNLQHNDLIRVGNTTLRFTVFDGPIPVEA